MEKIWKAIEKMMHCILCRVLRLQLSEEQWEKLCQFVKFGMVGVSNTLISYVIYAILVRLHIHYLVASIAGFIVSVINAYYWNNKYVFEAGEDEKRTWWSVFLKTFTAYAGTGLVLNNILLIVWVDLLHWPKMLGPIVNLLITIPINFVLNKCWAFKKNK